MKPVSGKKNSLLYGAVIVIAVIVLLVVFFGADEKAESTLESNAAPSQDATVAVNSNSIPMPQALQQFKTQPSLGNKQRMWL